jgi:hypothetical protein
VKFIAHGLVEKMPKVEKPQEEVLKFFNLVKNKFQVDPKKYQTLKQNNFKIENVDLFVEAAGVLDLEVYKKVVLASPFHPINARNEDNYSAIE